MANCRYNYLLIIISIIAFKHSLSAQVTGDSLMNVADIHYRNRDYREAIVWEKAALRIYQNEQNQLKQSSTSNNLGLYFYRLGEYDSSLFYYQASLDIDIEINNVRRQISRYKNIGITYKNMGAYQSAASNYTKALELSELSDNQKERASIFNSLGNLYLSQQKPQEAIRYYQLVLALKGYGTSDHLFDLATNNLGSAFFQLQNYDSAVYFYRMSLVLKSKLEQSIVGPTLNNLAEVYLAQGEIDSAAHLLKRAYDLKKTTGNAKSIGLTLNNLGKLELKRNQYRQALAYLKEASELFEQTKARNLEAENLLLQSRSFKNLGRADSAFYYYSTGKQLQDSIFQLEKLQVLDQLNNYEKRVIETEKASIENEVNTQKKLNRQQGYLIVTIIILLLVSVVFLLNTFNRRKSLRRINRVLDEQNKQVTQLNAALEMLNQEVKHRKQNDYNRLLSTIDLMQYEEEGANELLSPLQSVIHAAYDIDDFLDHNTNADSLYLDLYLNELIERLRTAHELAGNDIRISTDLGHFLLDAKAASTLAYIISELVNNTAKHVKADSMAVLIEINIIQSIDNQGVSFEYYDNGKDEKALEKLGQSKGLGWSILEKFTASLNAKMEVSRKEGRTRFGFVFNL